MTGIPEDHQPAEPPVAATEPGWLEDGEFGDCLTAEELAELARQDWQADCPDPDDPRYADENPVLSASEWQLLLADEDERARCAGVPETVDAGFTHRLGGTGTGFSAGGPLDVMLPGSRLGWHVFQVYRRGAAALDDDQLIGLLAAVRRQASLDEALQLDLVAELDRRRAEPDGTPGEHVSQELAAALTLTSWSANALLDSARGLTRLPKTWALLAAGIIDRHRAAVIARHTAVLSDADAAKVEDLVLPRAGEMATGELGSLCLRAVLQTDPQAARKRKEKALKDARVETWFEDSGTAALAGRDLPPAAVIAADKRIDAIARWLKTQGAPGTLEQLRANVYLAILNDQPIHTLLPQPMDHADDADTTQATAPEASSAGHDATDPASSSETNHAATGPSASSPGAAAVGLTGTVHLVMPYDTWQGLSDNPGEIAGYGAADAGTCRDIARQMAATPATRWCITLTDRPGRPTGHGCARAGPGPPGTAAWLAAIIIHPIETSSCAHLKQSAGYQPSNLLRHIIKTRSRRCGFPGCRRPATRCDDDHSIPYHLGGKTCECNLYPLCRRHHRCKQAPGWHLDQPRPGELIWTAPSGRTYTKITEPYPV